MPPRLPLIRPGSGPGRPATKAADTFPGITAVSPNSGRIGGGLTVTITGRNFRVLGDGTQPVVKFNGVNATGVTVVSQTSLTCVTPASVDVGLVDVTVTIGTQMATLAGSFTYSTSVVVGITPNYGPLAGGTAVVITGHNFLIGSTVAFDGSAASNVVFIDDEHISCNTPNHAIGYADVTVTEP